MLTREQQEKILCPIVIAYRLVEWGGSPRPRSYEAEMRSFRAALRLDDYHLSNLIAAGLHKQPWTSEVASCPQS